MKSNTLQIGDIITCHSKDDLCNTMCDLAKCGVITDFNYDVADVFRLEVVEIEAE